MRLLYVVVFLFIVGTSCSGGASGDANSETADSTTHGVITTASGLQVEMLREGNGEKPSKGDLVSVHYLGTLKANGEKFDSSYDRGMPIEFPIGMGRVIPGWEEGIAMLSKGAKAKLTIPANLAYGSMERPGIPANSDLVFEVELVDIKEGPKPIAHDPWPTEGVEMKETASGLKYHIVEEGTGPQAEAGKMVKVHYYGYLKANGQKFDSSFDRGEPIEFPLGQHAVIPGWEEGISLLKEGAKATIIIPSKLAYGEQGYPPVIPPNSDLVFDVQLVSVK